MRARHLGIALSLILSGTGLDAAAADAERLLADARQERAHAEAELAAGRDARAEQHAALLGEIDALSSELAAARAATEQARDRLSALQERRRQARAEHALLRSRVQRRSEQLRHFAADAADDDAALPQRVDTTIDARLQALRSAGALRVHDEEVLARDGSTRTVPVVDFGAVALAAGDDPTSIGLLRKRDGGRRVVGGPQPNAAQREAIAAAAAGQAALLPLDVDGSLAARSSAPPWSLGTWVQNGGPFVWPILAVAAAALLLFGERLLVLMTWRAPPQLVGTVIAALQSDARDRAANSLAEQDGPMARVLGAGVQSWGRGSEQREAALESALLGEETRLERGLKVLAVLAAIAPLLGLLGTVTGMITTFDVIAVHGTGNPRLLSGGIAEALISTQLGLIVAVPILLLHAVLARVVERRRVALEQAATALLGSHAADSNADADDPDGST